MLDSRTRVQNVTTRAQSVSSEGKMIERLCTVLSMLNIVINEFGLRTFLASVNGGPTWILHVTGDSLAVRETFVLASSIEINQSINSCVFF